MFTLFGNDDAVRYARTGGNGHYPAGSTLYLVTWRQQEDSRWVGAEIPAQPKSVELVWARASADGPTSYKYKNYEGAPLTEIELPANREAERIVRLVSLRAAVMP